ncbi:hypothetical protein LTR37_012779 [Vermiconidia calcicola]|uniref:Uncharacterized protein n=1 Tax=Vermiconidia calcicola TaxID=1690605 RepID=A0ACC3N174_9PEZI|nr:hypothetical protein LTR37_012779 [Vermiconidia calcicola]
MSSLLDNEQHMSASSEDAHKVEPGPEHADAPMLASSVLSHSLPANDPASPQNWPLHKKIFTSLQGWLFGFTVALGITCFSAGKVPLSAEFGLSTSIPEKFLGAFSLYIFGIVFAPYWTPHVVERVGRTIPYAVALTLNALFNLGAGLSHSLAGVMVCRFFAGFFGGPTLVSLEGTFADLWSAQFTNTYYAVQGLAAFTGTGLGALVGGQLVSATGGWRWTQYFPVCLAAAVLLVSINMPETYQREIPRRRARYQNKTRAQVVAAQTPAESGTTIAAMMKCTVIRPAIMVVTEPIVCLTSIIMFFTFATTFQWFIAVPAALGTPPPNGPGYSVDKIGLAFLTAIIGSTMGALTVIVLEQITNSINRKKIARDPMAAFRSVEYRVVPAMFGTVFVTVSLFWVGNTVNPAFKPLVPIIGTAFFVWGSSMITFSIVPYLFDSFQPAGTLSAITAQAVARLIAAGVLPLVILQNITMLTPKWGLGLFGFISLAMWPIPFVLFFFGTGLRAKSKYSMAKQ